MAISGSASASSFHSLATGQPRLALPSLGGLFAETQCPDLDSASLSNRDLLSAMRPLRWFSDRKTGKRPATPKGT